MKVCEEVKKEHTGTRFHVSYLYFHKNDLRIASDCIDLDLLGGRGGGGILKGMPSDPPKIKSFFTLKQLPCLLDSYTALVDHRQK